MDRRHVAILLLVIPWVVAMGLSGLSLMAEPTGDGFTRGLNRITGFLGWQLAGAFPAIAFWMLTRTMPKGAPLRLLGRVPAWWAVALLALVVAWIAIGVIGSQMGAPGSFEAPGPVTAPVD